MHELKYALDENDQYLEKNGLTLHYLFKPMRGDFQYYKEVDLKNSTDKTIREHGAEIKANPKGEEQFNEKDPMFLNATKNVKKEGVYYLSYIYE